MFTLVRGGGRLSLKVFALALGTWIPTGSSLMADDVGHTNFSEGRFKHDNLGEGTLGWAEYGLYPGLYGFSLRWHLGYGYGRYALGVGADGGYPFYGGPGYPHEPPPFRRFGPEAPFTYFGGPEYPCDGDFNFFQGIGGLAIEKPVVAIGEPGDLGHVNENGDVAPGRDFGPFTGAIPYPETYFARNTYTAATTGSSGATGPARPLTTAPNPPATGAGPPATSLSPAVGGMARVLATGRDLGIDEEPVADAENVRGIQVTKIYAGSPADKAGLRVGDVIYSVNRYLTTERGNLAWIITVAAPDGVLNMSVRSVVDNKVHPILVNLLVQPVSTERPSFLPPVGYGPPPASR